MRSLAFLAALVQQPPAPNPVPPYWQQRLEYDITATLDESQGTLGGTQRVVYHNNSPDTLRTVSFHLYLNAFRPGSRWAAADSAEGRRRFNDLADPNFGFNRVRNATIEGQAVEPFYPFAPDSTIVRYTLPRAAAPGTSFVVSLDWAARPPTVVRRSGRRGRQYDLGQWYPRVVAYDRFGWAEHALYPAGEFYGDFGSFRVTFDLPHDQVIGATGVPICGDPGWGPGAELGREAYGAPDCSTVGTAATGRKRVVFEARDVHHFAASMNPAFRHEGGRYRNTLIHVLHLPGDTATWARGIAVDRTRAALEWLDGLFGPFPWPQITNVHRLDRGGTEYPMMIHDSSATQGLITHETGHNYLMGILANNEWREGFLDEGFTSFQTSWSTEERDTTRTAIANNERNMLLLDLDRWSEPVSLVSERYRDFSSYNSMVYNRAELFYRQLRHLVGDSTMRRILRTYYDRWKLKHVDEAAFRAVAEEVSRRDLSGFFGQWLHGRVLYDYTIGRVKSDRGTDGRWRTRVEVVRNAAGMFPVTVAARSRGDSAVARASGEAEREWVELTTAAKPREVEVDSEVRAHDWNQLNNRKTRGLLGYAVHPRRDFYLDRFFSQPVRRDRLTVGLAPTAWYNDEGGVTLGGRIRTDYLGRFERTTLQLSMRTHSFENGEDHKRRPDFYLKASNPTRLYAPRTTLTAEGYWVEGRAGAAAAMERQINRHRTIGPETWIGSEARWLVTTDSDYLDPALWDAGGTVEARTWIRSRSRGGTWTRSGRLELGGGFEYRNRGAGTATENAYDAQPYLRVLGEVTARRSFGAGRRWGLSVRGFGGWVESGRRPLKQRQLFVSGADPYEQLGNPFLRSKGSLLAGRDVHYQMPGGGGVRGVAPGTTATRLLALNLEADRSVFRRADRDTTRQTGMRLGREVRIAAFADGALGNGDIPAPGGDASLVADAGLGVRIGHRIGQTSFITRFDVPLLVTRPRLAVDDDAGSVRFRLVVSLQ